MEAHDEGLRQAALDYHRKTNGKYEIYPTKPMSGKNDLSMAYSPGVAYPCLDIQQNPEMSYEVTNRGNTVGVLTNGTRVLGLGDVGVLAAKPVMEGKVCLMKELGDVDAIDVGINTKDPEEFINAVTLL